MKFKRINASSNARLIKLLVDNDATCYEAADHVGLHYLTVARFMRELHKQKVIHICEWRRDSRGCANERVWGFGERRDARKPPALTNTQRKQAARARKVQRAMIQMMAGGLAA
jgi:hypothetical protein